MASEKRETKSSLTFSSVPHDEAEYKGWRHETYRAVRAKFLEVKDRLPQEKTKDVDKYLNAFLHGEVIPITSELESNDAAVGVALSQSLEKHPMCKTIRDKFVNDAVVDGLTTLTIMDQFLKSVTDEGKKNIAFQKLLNMPFDKSQGIDRFIETFRSLAIEAEQLPGGANDGMLVSMMTAKLSTDDTYGGVIESFRDLPTGSQKLEKLITKLRMQKATKKEMHEMKHGSMHISQISNDATDKTLYDNAGNAYVMTQSGKQQASQPMQLFDNAGKMYVLAPSGKQGPNWQKQPPKGPSKAKWDTEPSDGECPYHINLTNGCWYGDQCSLKHVGDTPGLGRKPKDP